MKKLKVLSLVAAATGMVVLTSCMKGNSEYTNTDFGVVQESAKTFKKIVYVATDYYPIFIPAVENDFTISEGDCVYVNYKVNQEQPENVNAAAYGYYTAADGVVGMVLQSKRMYDGTPDTATVKDNEMLFKNAAIVRYLQSEKYKRFIVQGVPTSYLKDQKNNYYLSCDMYQEPQTVGTAERVYTLFLRATLNTPGQAPSIENGADFLAFEAGSFYERLSAREKAAGKDKIFFTIKYPTAFNSDSSKVTEWKGTDPVYLPILSDENKSF